MGANEMEVQVAELDELQDAQPLSDDQHRKLDTILDIPVTISMEVGRSNISIRNLLQLNSTSIEMSILKLRMYFIGSCVSGSRVCQAG